MNTDDRHHHHLSERPSCQSNRLLQCCPPRHPWRPPAAATMSPQCCSTTNCMQTEVWQDFSHNTGRVDFKLSVLVFNCLNNLALSYLSTMYQPVANNAGRCHLRLAVHGDLAVPATKTGSSMWNSLPVLLHSCHLPSSFPRDLKTDLFIRAYHQHARDCL